MRSVLVTLGVALLMGLPSSEPKADSPPNMIVVLTDDQGYADVGFHGHPLIETPNLDAFATQATSFDKFLTSPVCSATRASLLTGRYNYRTDVHDTWLGRTTMNPGEVTIAEVLKDNGYATGIFGKWHLGDNHPMRPLAQGFDESLVHLGGGIGQRSDPIGGSSYFDPILQHNGVPKKLDGYVMDVYTDHTIDFMERNQDQPFFAFLSTNTPHDPWNEVPAEDRAPYENQGLSNSEQVYLGQITNIDRNFQRVIDKVDELGIADNTIVVFMSDNGQASAGQSVYRGGLRGGKTNVYENGIRVPFFIDMPGDQDAGAVIHTQAAHIDVMPTLLDAAGIDYPDSSVTVDGTSLLPLMEEQDPTWEDRSLFFQAHRGPAPNQYQNAAVRTDEWKLVLNTTYEQTGTINPRPVLYHLPSDPDESNNVALDYPDVVAELQTQYESWFAEVTAGNDWRPHRIAIGSDAEPITSMTRLDWVDANSWNDDQVGTWLVDVEDAGEYDVILQFPNAEALDREVYFGEPGATQLMGTIPAFETEFVFERVQLEAGELDLQAYKLLGSSDFGVLRLIIQKSDLLGDLNNDGVLTEADVDAFVEGWRSNTSAMTASERIALGDVDFDDDTDLDDWLIVRQTFRDAGVPVVDYPPGIPEPSALVLATLVAAAAGAWPLRPSR